MNTLRAAVTAALLVPLSLTFVLAQTQGELNQQACDAYKSADVELNGVYQRVLSEYKGDALFDRKMKAAQHAWIAYRDAHLESLYPAEDPRLAYGSVYPMCRCMVLMEVTKKRTEILRRWVAGEKEGDVCVGSVKVRN
jgi:uncharacterized protein YecT (DUF1311 family)